MMASQQDQGIFFASLQRINYALTNIQQKQNAQTVL